MTISAERETSSADQRTRQLRILCLSDSDMRLKWTTAVADRLVRDLASPARSAVFTAHRRDDRAVHGVVRSSRGFVASTGGLPVELVAGHFGGAPEYVTLPSTTVFTLPIAAPASRLECWEIPDHWWMPDAPAVMRTLTAEINKWTDDGNTRERKRVEPVLS